MKKNWNLDVLYKSFESKKLEEEKSLLEEELNSAILWAGENFKEVSTHNLEEILKKFTSIYGRFERIFNFGELSFATNVQNEKALALIEYAEGLFTKVAELEVIFKETLRDCDALLAIIETSDYLKEHKFHILEKKEEAKSILSKEEELLLEQMKNTGSRTFSKLQDTLTSTLLIPFKNGDKEEMLNLSAIRNLAYDKNKDIRKRAYEAELKAYKNIEISVATCLNGIKGEALTETKLRGFDSILTRTLKNSRLSKETLMSMLEVMKESLPYFAKFLKHKAKLLGHENSLPFYDLFAPVGDANLTFTHEEARDFILKNFYTFSDKLGNLAKRAFDEAWIDFDPYEGKVGGAFCSNIQSLKQSRILSNFTGSFSDVLTLAHELGHAFHGEALNGERILNSDYPMPLAETASIFCETIVKNAVLEGADKTNTITILEQDISDSLQVIVDIYSRFSFENKVINERSNGSISPDKFREFMVEAQKESYLDGLDHDLLHPYMWICKGHYYSADSNYYNYPYAFGLLFAKGLYVEYLKDKDTFVEKYNELLALTGKSTIEDIGKFINIDFTKKDFWKASLELIKKDIDTFIELTS